MKGGPTFLNKKKIRKDKNNQSKEKENEGKRDMNLNIRIKYNNRAIKGEGGGGERGVERGVKWKEEK